MTGGKLDIHFHNPNSAQETAEFLIKLFVEASREKLDAALEDARRAAL